MKYKFISSDDHMDLNWLPQDLWQVRVPSKFKDRAPHVVDTDSGPKWVYGDTVWDRSGPGGPAGLPGSIDLAGLIEPGVLRCSDPALRLQDLDRDGQDAAVIYTLPLRFNGPDRELDLACLRAYNEWFSDFGSYNPERLIPLPLLPWWDPDLALKDLYWAKDAGFRGVQFDPFRSVEPVWHEMWEPLWAAAAETGLPLSFHEGGSRHPRSVDLIPHRGQNAAYIAVAPLGIDEIISSMIFSGALDRHPNLRVVFAETGLAWVAWLLERMETLWHRYFHKISDVKLSSPPLELFRRQALVTFQEEDAGVKCISNIGVESVMWAADYPHPVSPWPHSQEFIRKRMGDVLSQDVLRKITCDNAARLYSLN